MSKLPHELILQLIASSDAIDKWLLATGEEHVGIPAAIAIRRISNSITDLITDSEVGDAQFAADNCDWPCLSKLREV